MTLRVEDLKPGDVVRMDITFSDIYPDRGEVHIEYTILTNADLAAGNAELVVRPRPVRKGDEVRDWNGGPSLPYIAKYGGHAVVWLNSGASSQLCEETVHADGSPIDWEASE